MGCTFSCCGRSRDHEEVSYISISKGDKGTVLTRKYMTLMPRSLSHTFPTAVLLIEPRRSSETESKLEEGKNSMEYFSTHIFKEGGLERVEFVILRENKLFTRETMIIAIRSSWRVKWDSRGRPYATLENRTDNHHEKFGNNKQDKLTGMKYVQTDDGCMKEMSKILSKLLLEKFKIELGAEDIIESLTKKLATKRMYCTSFTPAPQRLKGILFKIILKKP